jgi:type I restriction enzyme M protein
VKAVEQQIRPREDTSADSAGVVAKAWNFAHVLRDVGLSHIAYTEQITCLLFLQVADELTRPPHKRPAIVPPYDWPNLLKREGDELEVRYRHTLEELGKKPGTLGQVFLRPGPTSRTRHCCTDSSAT